MRDKIEKLGSLFLAVFASGLALVLWADGLEGTQLLGATLAVTASIALAVAVRVWPHPKPVKIRDEDQPRD